MKEMHIIPGRCDCGCKVEHRICDVAEDDVGPVFAWLIYGNCKKCEKVIMMALIKQEEEPIQGIDYIIKEDEKAEISKEGLGNLRSSGTTAG